ncbi:hypothetical protein BGZ76_008676 [Entomortierella beljakovae]|nr:hypothetical protein BGZ76_008676 [Entomortierella beljakovae]
MSSPRLMSASLDSKYLELSTPVDIHDYFKEDKKALPKHPKQQSAPLYKDLIPTEFVAMESQIMNEVAVVKTQSEVDEGDIIYIDYDDLLFMCAKEEDERHEMERQYWRELKLIIDKNYLTKDQRINEESDKESNSSTNSCIIEIEPFSRQSIKNNISNNHKVDQDTSSNLARSVSFDETIQVIGYSVGLEEADSIDSDDELCDDSLDSPGWISFKQTTILLPLQCENSDINGQESLELITRPTSTIEERIPFNNIITKGDDLIKNSPKNSCPLTPKSLELMNTRLQLSQWSQAVLKLREQEKLLTNRIGQLVEELNDVLDKCQDTEMGLINTETAVQQLKRELIKEQEFGLASVQEAAISNHEKQKLEKSLKETWEELDTLRAARIEQDQKQDRHQLDQLYVKTIPSICVSDSNLKEEYILSDTKVFSHLHIVLTSAVVLIAVSLSFGGVHQHLSLKTFGTEYLQNFALGFRELFLDIQSVPRSYLISRAWS